jgi:hypothetical protein
VSCAIAEKATIASMAIDVAPIYVQDGAGVIGVIPLDSTNGPVVVTPRWKLEIIDSAVLCLAINIIVWEKPKTSQKRQF